MILAGEFQGVAEVIKISTKDLSGPMDLNYIPDNLSDPKNVCIPQDLYPWGLQFDPLPPPIGLTCIFPPPTTLHF